MKYNDDERFKGPKEHFKLWYKKFAKEYRNIAETNGVLSAFSALSQFQLEIKIKLESLKREIELFSEMIKAILIPKEEIRSNELIDIHDELYMSLMLTFSTQTLGDFSTGAMDRDGFQGKLIKYLKQTNQKKKNQLLLKVPIAYKKRYLADKLYHQKRAIEYLIEQLIAENYPVNAPKITLGKSEIDLYLIKKEKTTGKNTPEDFYRDIHSVISEIFNAKNEEFFRKDDSLIIKRAVEYALDRKGYFEKWGRKGKNDKDGYSKEWHEKKFKEIYEALFKN